MKLSQPYKCDIHPCEKIKGENNHWFMLAKPFAAPLNRSYGGMVGAFLLTPWDDDVAENDDAYMHVCSEECAIRALSQWLTKAKGTPNHVQQS